MNSSFVTNSVENCTLMELSKHARPNGNLTVVEGGKSVPFDVRRVYYLYDIPAGETRGGHAHRNLYQLLVAASGSFDVVLDDGANRRTVSLNRPNYGLLIVPGIWRELENFSSGAVCLVLASEHYDEEDYIETYADFVQLKQPI